MFRNPDAITNYLIFIFGVQGLTRNAILAALKVETGDEFDIGRVNIKDINEKALERLTKGGYPAATKGLAIKSNFNEEDSMANFWDRVENELVEVERITLQNAIWAFMDCKESVD